MSDDWPPFEFPGAYRQVPSITTNNTAALNDMQLANMLGISITELHLRRALGIKQVVDPATEAFRRVLAERLHTGPPSPSTAPGQ